MDVSPILNIYSQDDPYWFRHDDDYSSKTNFARTTNFKYTHFNRIVEMWNSVPLDIRLSPSLAGMKTVFNVFIFDLIFF